MRNRFDMVEMTREDMIIVIDLNMTRIWILERDRKVD